jgi:hypothetical protein
VLLGIPGNHDWYDGLDGFARLFRRSILEDLVEPPLVDDDAPAPAPDDLSARVEGAIQRHLHVDEVGESLRLAKETVESIAALLGGSKIRRPTRLAFRGYVPVQEASYWALPLGPGLDLWGADSPGRRLQAARLLREAAAETPTHKVVFVAPELAYGEPNEPGGRLVAAARANRLLLPDVTSFTSARASAGRPRHRRRRRGIPPRTRIAPTAGSWPLKPSTRQADESPDRPRDALASRGGDRGFLPHSTLRRWPRSRRRLATRPAPVP